MNIKLLTVASHLGYEGLDRLVSSAQKFGWDIEVIVAEWKGFGTKLIAVYNHLKENPDITNFVFVDAYDVVVLSTPEEFESKLTDKDRMLVSVEKACWPDPNLASQYPDTTSEWKYVNSGSYYSPSQAFIETFEANVPEYANDDQLWLTKAYLASNGNINLDYDCKVFQAYSFISEGDFSYENGRLQNLKTNTEPICIHGNGKTDMNLITKFIK